ncbi:hypothetical protein PHLCEN_2v2534 [Hermanssonia centrifuga]|uniref:Chromatin modification-related protein n=1 Tax=Hermanssonia centrifuga TaxID=98765 RepID=A0A2R6RLL9_9APHY|nr:hypothetical protein PHLCEN_2v2534 [Hermanssonia centrifuga]
MSFRKYRNKRRRSQAFPREDTDAHLAQHAQTEDVEMAPPDEHLASEPQEADSDVVTQPSAKEQEVWDTFREENYEGDWSRNISARVSSLNSSTFLALEQLPLSLHRSYALIQELDEQVTNCHSKVLSEVQQYIALRTSMVKTAPPEPAHMDVDQSSDVTPQAVEAQNTPIEHQEPHPQSPSPPLEPASPGPSSPAKSKPRTTFRTNGFTNGTSLPTASSSKSPTSDPEPPPSPPSTRALLTSIAQTSETAMRASNEKVNVARFTHDLVDRYIRDLDRAIKEQETSLSLGLRPGTHPASIILPEIVLPKSLRAPRVMDESPAPDGIAELSAPAPSTLDTELTLGTVPTEITNNGGAPSPPPPPPFPPARRRIRPKKWTRQKQRTAEVKGAAEGTSKAGTPVGEESAAVQQRPVLKLTVPPLAAVAQQQQQDEEPAAQEEIDPSEERYCYCGMVSFGTMVACDRKGCEIEWFHVPCVGLETAPKGRWYCKECALVMKNPKRKRKRH